MKGAVLISILVVGVVAEPPAPYPASGWRPSGPAFDLPQKQYLPPLDPRIPSSGPTAAPGDDVSVQGLPVQEQLPLFQTSPISGQQYSGPAFNNDLRNLDKDFQQSQYEQQQQRYREYQRQKEFEAAQARANSNRLPAPQVPRQFARTTTTTTTTEAPTTVASTTEFELNQEEVLNEPEPAKNDKVSVEVTKQKVQEYPGELFLSSLAQLQLQPQFIPFQASGAYLQPQTSQKQVAGFDGPAHFAALPSVLAQQQNGLPQAYQQPFVVQSEQVVVQPASQYQPNYQPLPAQQPEGVILQAPGQFQPNIYEQPSVNPATVQNQYQPQNFQPNTQAFPQFQAQPVLIPQNYAPQPENANEGSNQNQFYQQPIVVQPQYQPQLNYAQSQQAPQNQYVQPQLAPQNQYLQPQSAPQNQFLQPQLAPQNQYMQPQFLAPQEQQIPQNQYLQPQYLAPQDAEQFRGQGSLQSGLDLNQNGNDIEQIDEQANEENDGQDSATAVATAFGTRTQPRVNPRYGAPFPVPRVQANPEYATTTETAVEEVTEGAQAVAVAVANGEKRKSARLRSRRLRPVFAVDRSGHLVLAEV